MSETTGRIGMKRAERALRAADASYRALFSLIKDAAFVVSAETGMIVDANPVAEALTGHPLSELYQLHHTQLHPSGEAEIARREFARVVQQSGVFRNVRSITERTIVHRDGRIIPVDIQSTLWTGPDGTALVFQVCRNISEIRHAADALRRSEERFRYVAELTGEFIWEINAEGLYTYASPAVQQLLGYTPEHVVGKMHFFDFFVAENREEMKHAALAVIGRREPFVGFATLNVRSDGSIVALETRGVPVYDDGGSFVGYRGADRDVTERQRVESLLRAVMNSSPDPIFVKDCGSRMLLANPATLAMFQKPEGEVLGKTDEEICADPAAGRQIMANDRQVVETGQSLFLEEVVPGPGGPRVFLSAKVPYRDMQGRIIGLIGIARDITERKRAEEAVRKSELKYRQLHESITDAVMTVDMAGHILEVNPAYEAMLGYTATELRRLTYHDVTPERWRALEEQIVVEQVLREGHSRVYEKEYRHRDGTVFPVELRRYLLRDENGEPAGMWSIVRDISERKRAEQVLRDSERRFRALFDNNLNAVLLTRMNGTIEAANPAACAMFGMTEEEICSTGRAGLVVDDDRLRALLEARRLAGSARAELTYVRKDGTIFDGDCTSAPLGEGDAAFVIIRDITERKRAAEALRLSEEKFSTMFRCIPVSVTVSDLNDEDRFIEVNKAFENYTGLSRETVIGRTYPPGWLWADAGEYEKAVAQFSRDGRLHDYEFRFRGKRGEIRHGILFAEPIQLNNRMCVLATTIDITERRRAEEALRESEERFRNMADTAPVMIWVSGPDNLGTFFNKAWLDFTGRTMEQELGDGWISGVHPDDLEHCLATCGASFEACRPFQTEFRLRRADGEYRWILDTGVPRYRDSEFVGFIGSCVDLTERKLIEEQLRAREAQLTNAQRLAQVGSSEVDIRSGTVYWSDEMFRIVGLRNDVQPGVSSFLSHVHPGDREIVLEARDTAASSTAPVQAHFRIVRPDGDMRFVRSVVEAIKDERGLPVRFRVATQDITEQVSATQRLRDNEKRLSNAERIAHVGNWRWDVENKRVYWSAELRRILGYPRHAAASYENFIQLVVPGDRDRVAQWATDHLAGKGESSLEFQIARPDGEQRTVTCAIEVILDDRGLLAHVSGTCQDVTDARRAQAESFARQKLESLGTLASGIAHDFNNLLGGVLAQAELAAEELAAGSDPQQELKEIRDAAIRGSEIVRQLMIYAGKESDVVEPVDMSRGPYRRCWAYSRQAYRNMQRW